MLLESSRGFDGSEITGRDSPPGWRGFWASYEPVVTLGLQVQERLTQQVADWLHAHLGARGVGVVLEAEHLCMSLRGVRARGSRTVTSALRGDLRTHARSRGEFLALTRHAQ